MIRNELWLRLPFLCIVASSSGKEIPSSSNNGTWVFFFILIFSSLSLLLFILSDTVADAVAAAVDTSDAAGRWLWASCWIEGIFELKLEFEDNRGEIGTPSPAPATLAVIIVETSLGRALIRPMMLRSSNFSFSFSFTFSFSFSLSSSSLFLIFYSILIPSPTLFLFLISFPSFFSFFLYSFWFSWELS